MDVERRSDSAARSDELDELNSARSESTQMRMDQQGVVFLPGDNLQVARPVIRSRFTNRLARVAAVFLVALAFTPVSRGQQSPANAEAGVPFTIGPAPAWVREVSVPTDGPIQQESTGSYFLLIERQTEVASSATYWREVRKITSEQGVQGGASVSMFFNPAFEKLTAHSIRLIRNGVASDLLERSKINFRPSEQDPRRQAYDQSYTARIPLEGVRVGDVIEFAYTTEGANPLRRRKFSEVVPNQWSFPVARRVLRVVYPSQRKLEFQLLNDSTEPAVSVEGGKIDWFYEATNVPGLKVEENAPEDYNPRRQVHVSEFASWAEVAEWALPLFQPAGSDSPEFEAEVSKLKTIADPEQRVVAALRFLQGEIQYMQAGLDSGLRPPTSLGEVVRRRFGDSKDETVLLVELLRRTGIDAAPALVSYYNRSKVRDFLPSPTVFDHAVVQVRLGQSTYWVDPMRSAQRGPLPQIYIANYGFALVLRPDTTDLTSFRAPTTSWQSSKVTQNFRIRKPGADSELDVISEYHGLAADRTRSSFQESTREEIQKRYLDFYAREYPDVRVAKQVWYEELPGANACRVTESYVIPNLWQLSEDKESYRIYVRPDSIYSALGSTVSPQRRDPLSLNHPNTVTEEIKMQMFEPWGFEAKSSEIGNEFFKVRDDPKARGSFVQLNYVFVSQNDRLPPSEIPQYNEAVEKAKETLGYTFTYQTPEQLKRSRRQAPNWAVGAAALSFFGTAGYAALRYFGRSRLAIPMLPPADLPPRLKGIGGWLILLAVIHILRPLGFIKMMFDLWPKMYNTSSWRSLTDPIESSYHPWWAPTLLYELFLATGGLVFCILLIALFFGKRAVWPRCLVAFLVANLLAQILDACLLHQIPAAEQSTGSLLRQLVPPVLAAAVWIPYVFRSKRVKATFRI